MGPGIQKTFLIFSLLVLFTACSSSLTELKSSSVTVIFDYQNQTDTPSVHLAAFSEPSQNVRRCEEIKLVCKENNFEWKTSSPVKFQYNNKYYAGYTNFVMPDGEKIPEGSYDFFYTEADESQSLYSTHLQYNQEFYTATAEQAHRLIDAGGYTQMLAIYDENSVLLYFGEYKVELKNEENIVNRFKTAAARREIYFSNNESTACLMPAEKLNGNK